MHRAGRVGLRARRRRRGTSRRARSQLEKSTTTQPHRQPPSSSPTPDLFRLEVHGDAVDAVAQMRGRRAILENMPEVAAAAAAMHLGAHHAVAAIGRGLDRAFNRNVEARPPGAALELLLRHEQVLTAGGAAEGAGAFLIVEGAAAGSLGPVPAQYVVLLRRQ